MANPQYQKLTITLPKELLQEYREFLGKIGMGLSKRLAILIEEDFKKLNKIVKMEKWLDKQKPSGFAHGWQLGIKEIELKDLKREAKIPRKKKN